MADVSSQRSKVVVPHSANWKSRLAAGLISITVRCMAATVRFHLHDPIRLMTGAFPKNVIFVTWHNRLALSLSIYNRFFGTRQPGCRMAAMVSASRDGALLARVLENFRVQPVRGSTSRRGPQALLELTKWAERGYDLSITPDGPRGPRYAIQSGVLALAQLTGLPIIPVGVHLHPKICLGSWDKFQVPVPFGRCEVVLGNPIAVRREASDEEREALRAELQERLLAVMRD
ncbi:MAG: lysophospholipid acyltransferase family protein [Verrucomicrobia bacterium]|nr:lysophospholipid acyltransferase family protein [Verrucomicrobiota bacterium]